MGLEGRHLRRRHGSKIRCVYVLPTEKPAVGSSALGILRMAMTRLWFDPLSTPCLDVLAGRPFQIFTQHS